MSRRKSSGKGRRTLLILGGTAAVAVVVLAGAASSGVLGGHTKTAAPSASPPATAEVTRKTMERWITVPGAVTYGSARPLTGHAQGTVTWLPASGTVLRRGDELARIDDRPVVLLYGKLPAYRELALDTKGEDVKVFTTNLSALGYGGFTPGDTYTAGVEAAVKRWQKALGAAETGKIALGDVVYADGARRVAQRGAAIGAAAVPELLTVTGTTPRAKLTVPVEDSELAVKGVRLKVSTTGGKSTDATVISVGAPHTGDSGENVQDVTVSLVDPSAVSRGTGRGSGTLTGRYLAGRHENVLTVPVSALLALSGGGYGVEVLDGHGRGHVVAVRIGLFVDGRVEVTGEGLAPGAKVGTAR
ncbi:peptidoglycan-binding protein [Streptomyces sp. PA03-1a]|nr:peptidoglycan-binding protein [Streptomyces sp. PA03-1a]MDX2816764.1 peptidoglycan-binding protein [Streptomyces sp. PA03-5A]